MEEKLHSNQNLKSHDRFYYKMKIFLLFAVLMAIVLLLIIISNIDYHYNECQKLNESQCKISENCRVGQFGVSVPTKDGGHLDAIEFKCFSVKYCERNPWVCRKDLRNR